MPERGVSGRAVPAPPIRLRDKGDCRDNGEMQ